MTLRQALVLIAVLTVFEDNSKCSSSFCSNNHFHIKDGVDDRILEDRIFKTIKIRDYRSECFVHCTMDCRCLSFNVYDQQCQLNADKKDMKNNSLKIKHGCSYYDLDVSKLILFDFKAVNILYWTALDPSLTEDDSNWQRSSNFTKTHDIERFGSPYGNAHVI